jgi:hypothetical protein
MAGMNAMALRSNLDEAWNNRDAAVEGQISFDRIAAKSASLQATEE